MFSCILAAALAFSEADAHIAFKAAEGLVKEHTPRDAGTLRGRSAANYILDTASAAGADARLDRFTAMTPRGMKRFTNVYSDWTCNPTGKWVVVVSHYDTKPGVNCPGANDGASTTGLLVGLANALSDWRTPNANVTLMWLDAEECVEAYRDGDGFQGSKRAAQYLKESGREVAAVVCVDMLGDRNLSIGIPKNTTPQLRALALDAAGKAGIRESVHEMAEAVKDDHVAFLEQGFPALNLIDFDYGSESGLNDYWHTQQDTMDKISEGSLLVSGRLVCQLINLLFR